MAARDSVPDKMDYLFKTIRRPDGREYTYDDVERGTAGAVSRSYVWKLRHGRNRNPSLVVIEALGQFFDVPVTYFFESAQNPDDARVAAAVAGLIRQPGLRKLVEEAQGLGPEKLAVVTEVATGLKRLPM